MSSGFVSTGTTDNPAKRDDEWLAAQQELEASRRRKEDESKHQDGKSLYEVLQSNKAAKQDAFEESVRLKNQFRNLDEDEVEFLDSVLESTREKEDAVKRETSEQLGLFRRQQEEADRVAREEGRDIEGEGRVEGGETWAVKGKRKRGREKEGLKGFKLRKGSSTGEKVGVVVGSAAGSGSPKVGRGEIDSTIKVEELPPIKTPKEGQVISDQPSPRKERKTETTGITPTAKPAGTTLPSGQEAFSTASTGLGLAGYNSDEED